MGVVGFWNHVRSKCKHVLVPTTYEALAGIRLAIDATVYMYTLKARGDLALEFSALHASLTNAGIQPTYIFDGTQKESKRFEAARRDASRDRIREIIGEREEAVKRLKQEGSDKFLEVKGDLPSIVQADIKKNIEEEVARVKAECETEVKFLEAENERKRKAAADKPEELAKLEEELAKAKAAVEKKVEETREAPSSFDASAFIVETEKKAQKASSYITVTQEDVDAVIQRLLLERAPVVIAEGDAEAHGAKMCVQGKADALATDDGDALVFGTPVMIRNLVRPMNLQRINLEDLLEGLTLDSLEQFRNMAVLCGTDYTYARGIPKIGPVAAVKTVKKHGTIAKFIASEDWTKHKAKLAKDSNPTAREFDLEEDFGYEEALHIFDNFGVGPPAREALAHSPYPDVKVE